MKLKNRIISFLLIVCLMLPAIAGLGIDLSGIRAEAAMPSDSSTAYFKAGTANYWKQSAKHTAGTEVLIRDGVTYIPTANLTAALGITSFIAEKVSIDGTEYVTAVDGAELASGYYISLSNMNLVAVSSSKNVFDGVTNDDQVKLMKQFLFDSMNYDGSQNDVIDLSNVKTEHPYLLADQSEFDTLNSVYTGAAEDEVLKSYLVSLVNQAESVYKRFANSDGSLNKSVGLVGGQTDLSDMPYYTGNGDTRNGYDNGGRQSASTHTQNISYLAYAYQITRDEKYAQLSLDYAVAICSWEHWGAGHFLNAADASLYMAYAYDWCYNIWKSLDEAKFNQVREGLFTKGVMAGIYNTAYTIYGSNIGNEMGCPWVDNKVSFSPYVNKTNNWNAVCTSGMITAALAFIGDTDVWTGLTITAIDKNGKSSVVSANRLTKSLFGKTYIADAVGTTYREAARWLINNNIHAIEKNGLGQYIPDGSYIESAAYWDYGTSSLFRTIAVLDTVCGTDYGLSSAWGLDKTAYFPYYAQSSEGIMWRYHDDSNTALYADVNALFGAVVGDDNIVGYKKYLIEKGATRITYYDTFRYDADVVGFSTDAMELDHFMEGIQGFTSRSSWHNGSMYTAFMGGPNGTNHTQIDSGAFVYYNNGTKWFEDIGTENYNTYNFGYGTLAEGLKYYPVSAEGNNCLFTTGLTYGQEWAKTQNPNAYMEKYGSNDSGSYAVLDQTEMFASVASSAKRGMLITNDRKTVVIQDEVSFKSKQDAYWVAHTSKAIEITFSNDKKTAYMSDGKSMIRVTIVSDGDYTFEKKNFEYSEDYMILDYTDATGSYSTGKGGEAQKDYSQWQRLAVKCEGVTDLNLAIVIEEYIPGENYTVGYEWQDMSSWNDSTPVKDPNAADGRILIDQDFDILGIGNTSAEKGNISTNKITLSGDKVLEISAVSGNTAPSKVTVSAGKSRAEHAYLGRGLIVTEFDLSTSGTMLTNATFAIYGTDIYPIIEVPFNSKSFGTVNSTSQHITVVLDEETNTYHIFRGDTRVTYGEYTASSLEDISIVISTAAKTVTGSCRIDNIKMRSYSDDYTALDSIISSGSGMSKWEDRDLEPEYLRDYVATLSGGTETLNVASFDELATEIATGKWSYADIYAHTKTTVNISAPITVNTNGYKFYGTSSSYICEVSGDLQTYKTGTVTVQFITPTKTYTRNYSGTTVASYNISNTEFNKITTIREQEHTDKDGNVYYSYHVKAKNTWSKTDGGETLYGNDLIVTTDNCVFYMGEELYDGLYVTVSGGVVYRDEVPNVTDPTDKQKIESLFRNIIPSYTKYDRISLTSNITYESAGTATLNTDVNLYLNGYTLTYESSVISEHMFSANGKNLSVFGPGKIDHNATAANIFFLPYSASFNSHKIYVKGVEIDSTYVISDQRTGTLEFDNCVINAERTSSSTFTIDNYSGGVTNSYSDEKHLPVFILNGTTVNANSVQQPIVNFEDNVRGIIKNGTVINAISAPSAVYLGNKAGVDLMQLGIGEYYFSSAAFISTSENMTEDDLKNIVKYTEGVDLPTDSPADYEILDGYVTALTGSKINPYRIVKEDETAEIIWKCNGVTAKEIWAAGVVPAITENAQNILTVQTSPGYAYMYAYDFSPLEGGVLEAGKTYTFEAVKMTKIDIKTNISLEGEMTVNVYFEKKSGVTYNRFYINGEQYENYYASIVTISGKEYYMVRAKVAPAHASENIIVSYDINDGMYLTATTSIMNYAYEILTSDSYTSEAKALMNSVIDYIGAVSLYDGDRSTYTVCKSVTDMYSAEFEKSELSPNYSSTQELRTVIRTARLELGAMTSYIFKFNENYTGTVQFTYTSATGETVTRKVNVTAGKVNGKDTYALRMDAYDVAQDIVITAGDVTSTYNLSMYYTAVTQDNDALYKVLVALNTYSESARKYAESLAG